jgi:hypothetical protein
VWSTGSKMWRGTEVVWSTGPETCHQASSWTKAAPATDH